MRSINRFLSVFAKSVLILIGFVSATVTSGAENNEKAKEDAEKASKDDADSKADEAAKTGGDPNSNGGPDTSLCAGDPVDVVTGIMVTNTTDFKLPGMIPFIWTRSWYSDSRLVGHLGHGMRFNFEIGLNVNEKNNTLSVIFDMYPLWLYSKEILWPCELTILVNLYRIYPFSLGYSKYEYLVLGL
jgi:hypothetical protein